MKKIIIIVAFIFGLSSNAQTTKDELISVMSDETCECVNKEGKNLSKEEIQMKLGVCMLKSYNKRKQKFLDAGIKFDSYESGRKLGEQVGFKMAKTCPEVFQIFVNEKAEKLTQKKIANTTTGNITSITGNDFSYINLKDESGKMHKFLWFGNFEGSSRLIENPKLKSKVIIHYKSIECYVPKMNDYYSLKEITKIEFL